MSFSVTYTKSGGKSQFFLSSLSSTVNDIRRKPYMVGTYLTVGKQAKRMPDATVETTKLYSYSSMQTRTDIHQILL